MKLKIKDNQIYKLFDSVMRDYAHLESAERSYDWYDYEKHGYVDFNTVNYYEDVEMDWEDDGWIFQVQYEKGDVGVGLELPILRYAEYQGSGIFNNLKSMFGSHFEPLLKEWFNQTYPVETPIKTVTNEQD